MATLVGQMNLEQYHIKAALEGQAARDQAPPPTFDKWQVYNQYLHRTIKVNAMYLCPKHLISVAAIHLKVDCELTLPSVSLVHDLVRVVTFAISHSIRSQTQHIQAEHHALILQIPGTARLVDGEAPDRQQAMDPLLNQESLVNNQMRCSFPMMLKSSATWFLARATLAATATRMEATTILTGQSKSVCKRNLAQSLGTRSRHEALQP